jgi:hypothetical protein
MSLVQIHDYARPHNGNWIEDPTHTQHDDPKAFVSDRCLCAIAMFT